MRKQNDEKVIAILCADIHLSIKAPVWRSAEDDWFEAMTRPLEELRRLQVRYDCPILCAGDIFNKWNSPPELINFALEYLPKRMYCIPGQHDLPDHNYSEIRRSAYWTLVKAGKIKRLYCEAPASVILSKINVWGFSYGKKLTEAPDAEALKIALIHEYIWMRGHSYPNAPKEGYLKSKLSQTIKEKWLGYDIVIAGDNHNGFLSYLNHTTVFNCGCLMRRKSDEIDYKPQVGLLLESGKIEQHFLDISQDKYLDTIDDSTAIEELDIEEFLEELKKLGDTALEYTAAVERFFKKHKTHPMIQKIIRKAGEE